MEILRYATQILRSAQNDKKKTKKDNKTVKAGGVHDNRFPLQPQKVSKD
jgi:hypothetical protein